MHAYMFIFLYRCIVVFYWIILDKKGLHFCCQVGGLCEDNYYSSFTNLNWWVKTESSKHLVNYYYSVMLPNQSWSGLLNFSLLFVLLVCIHLVLERNIDQMNRITHLSDCVKCMIKEGIDLTLLLSLRHFKGNGIR